jgi:hypothetical protein
MKKPKSITLRSADCYLDVDDPHTVRDLGKSYRYGPMLCIGGTYFATPADAKRLLSWLKDAVRYLEANKNKRGNP